MSRIFSKGSALMFVMLAVFIIVFIPKVTHADTPSGNIIFGDTLIRPLPMPDGNHEV
jgi:hypothetical protein